jgi:hypothetical protein
VTLLDTEGDPTLNDIENIIMQLEQQRTAIDKAIAALREVSGDIGPQSSTNKTRATKAPARKRNISPEGRKRIAEATRRRWAAKRAAEKAASKVAGPAKKTRSAKKKAA